VSLLKIKRQIEVDATRTQPEFAAFRRIQVVVGEADQNPAVALSAEGKVILGKAAFAHPGLLGFYLRLALEWAWLQRRLGVTDAAAGLAASRATALFIQAEMDGLTAADRAALPGWVAAMASEVAPTAADLKAVAAELPGGPAGPATLARVRSIWNLLGTADALMETGGDIRLHRDPLSALNGYGCSHRPRPWAITFASSTASSSSERGYLAADLERLKTTVKLLARHRKFPPVRASLAAVRRGLGQVFGLDAATQVVLAASGTDTELLALALTHLAPAAAPILNILIAPEETGRGVPMAARGVHFAVDTARGHDVAFESPITGFRPDTEIANVCLRHRDGALRPAAEVEAEISAIVASGIGAGKQVILHVLDLSKTGLLAPDPTYLAGLRALYGRRFDIVVDACQARLSARAVNAYLQLDAVVLITGSKFFTGPPFTGALLVPAAIARRLAQGRLPAGLDAYFGRDEFPEGCEAASLLPPFGNYGLSLRWHAALAEMRAFRLVAPPRRAEILQRFGEVVRNAIAANPALSLLPVLPISRGEIAEMWERLPSIFSFSMRSPVTPERSLDPAEARAVYIWLNADLSEILPDHQAAGRICHIGQPVSLPRPDGAGSMGVLRVSAGARLFSGEPSHKGLAGPERLQREFADLATVFEKIGLILEHFQELKAANPAPHYRRWRAAGAATPDARKSAKKM
jgi:hypothetical protein